MDYKKIQKQTVNMLRKLAFGNPKGAASILFCNGEEGAGEIDKLDFSSIAKIKKRRDGSVEIAFVDRLKALEKLNELVRQLASLQQEDSLFEIIENSISKGGDSTEEPG